MPSFLHVIHNMPKVMCGPAGWARTWFQRVTAMSISTGTSGWMIAIHRALQDVGTSKCKSLNVICLLVNICANVVFAMLSVEKGVRKAWLRSLSQWLTENKIMSQSANIALKGFTSSCIYQRGEVTVLKENLFLPEEKPQIYYIMDEEAHPSLLCLSFCSPFCPHPLVFLVSSGRE